MERKIFLKVTEQRVTVITFICSPVFFYFSLCSLSVYEAKLSVLRTEIYLLAKAMDGLENFCIKLEPYLQFNIENGYFQFRNRFAITYTALRLGYTVYKLCCCPTSLGCLNTFGVHLTKRNYVVSIPVKSNVLNYNWLFVPQSSESYGFDVLANFLS